MIDIQIKGIEEALQTVQRIVMEASVDKVNKAAQVTKKTVQDNYFTQMGGALASHVPKLAESTVKKKSRNSKLYGSPDMILVETGETARSVTVVQDADISNMTAIVAINDPEKQRIANIHESGSGTAPKRDLWHLTAKSAQLRKNIEEAIN